MLLACLELTPPAAQPQVGPRSPLAHLLTEITAVLSAPRKGATRSWNRAKQRSGLAPSLSFNRKPCSTSVKTREATAKARSKTPLNPKGLARARTWHRRPVDPALRVKKMKNEDLPIFHLLLWGFHRGAPAPGLRRWDFFCVVFSEREGRGAQSAWHGSACHVELKGEVVSCGVKRGALSARVETAMLSRASSRASCMPNRLSAVLTDGPLYSHYPLQVSEAK